MYELKNIYENRKSFYGKAKVEEIKEGKILYSYGTKVCEIRNNIPTVVWSGYSQTTYRHIREFLQQEGFGKFTKKMIENLITTD